MKIAGLIMFLLFFGLPIGIFALVLKKFLGNAKKDVWEGEVVDKLYNEMEDDGKTSQYYTLVIKTAKGDRKMSVSATDYQSAKVGDRFKKVAGRLSAEKL